MPQILHQPYQFHQLKALQVCQRLLIVTRVVEVHNPFQKSDFEAPTYPHLAQKA